MLRNLSYYLMEDLDLKIKPVPVELVGAAMSWWTWWGNTSTSNSTQSSANGRLLDLGIGPGWLQTY